MTPDELEKATLDTLVDLMAPKLKRLIHELLRKGASVGQVREELQWHTRHISGREYTFTELSVGEYLDRIERGEIDPKEDHQ